MGIEIAWFQAVERWEKEEIRQGEMRLGKTVGIIEKIRLFSISF